jgi:hypothetical protein
MKKLLLPALLIILIAFTASAQTKIAASNASKHRGETVMICDKVYNTELVKGSNNIILSLGESYPNQYLTVIIKGADRSKFKEQPEVYFKGRAVCVTGTVVEYNGKPAIFVGGPSALKLDLVDSIVPIPVSIPKQ